MEGGRAEDLKAPRPADQHQARVAQASDGAAPPYGARLQADVDTDQAVLSTAGGKGVVGMDGVMGWSSIVGSKGVDGTDGMMGRSSSSSSMGIKGASLVDSRRADASALMSTGRPFKDNRDAVGSRGGSGDRDAAGSTGAPGGTLGGRGTVSVLGAIGERDTGSASLTSGLTSGLSGKQGNSHAVAAAAAAVAAAGSTRVAGPGPSGSIQQPPPAGVARAMAPMDIPTLNSQISPRSLFMPPPDSARSAVTARSPVPGSEKAATGPNPGPATADPYVRGVFDI